MMRRVYCRYRLASYSWSAGVEHRRGAGHGGLEARGVHLDAVPGAVFLVADALEPRARMDQREIDVEEHGRSAGHGSIIRKPDYRMSSLALMRDWKDTLNLPRTDFPMKANLPATEPATIARWEEMDLYGRIRAARRGTRRATCCTTARRTPTARSTSGHALNKILKDLCVKSRSMAGFDAPVRARAGTATACPSS